MKANSVKASLKRASKILMCLVLASTFCVGLASCGSSGSTSSVYIGDDGYWYINGEKTEYKAQGEDGKDGADGKDGVDGKDATTETSTLTVESIAETNVSPTGVTSGDISAAGKFYTNYSSVDEAREAAQVLNIQMAQEGQVLLKNEDNALPLNKNERAVTLLGIGSVDVTVSGGGSGSASQTSYTEAYDWESGLTEAGFRVNPKTLTLYENYLTVNAPTNTGSSLEIDMSYYTSSILNSFKGYNDAAIVVLHRWGTENTDLATSNADGHTDTTETELDLQDNERDLIKLAKQYFDKVVVIINSSNTMSLGELAEEKTSSNLGVDAILWVGGVGQVGTYAAGTILTGDTNPSGKTVDTWWSDVKLDPTFTNFGNMSQSEDGNATFTYNGQDTLFSTVEYRESIYMGYRYTETGYVDMEAAQTGAGEDWYGETVAYPFGYGLSYTSFKWELAGISSSTVISSATQTITMKIQVTNTGSVAGKDVVQVYYSAPYTSGGIEKAAVNLAGFAKTKLLQPGQSEIVTVQFVAQDMASYDYNDANNNDFVGYELEAGTYTISARSSSHEEVISQEYTIESDIKCETDYTTGETIESVFVDDYTTVRDSLTDNLLSRANGMSQPASETDEDRALENWEYQMLYAQETYTPANDSSSDPWYTSSVPSTWTQDATTTVKLSDLSGVTYTENKIVNGSVQATATDSGTQLWESYMNSLSWDDLVSVVANTKSDTFGGHDFSGSDGPVQFGDGTCWSTSPISAATWNEALLEAQGEMYGTEAIFNGNTAWHGGGINIHRSAFNGRNFEYYSEDGTLSGIMGAAVCKGVTSKGVVAYYKHFFSNTQEYKRADYGGVCTFATEQTFREIYLKAFERVVKAGSLGLMTSFNRIGYVVNSNNYAVHETLLRDEWDFTGCTITDAWAKNYVSLDLMARAGDDIVLSGSSSFTDTYFTDTEWNAEANLPQYENEDGIMVASATEYYAIRKSAQRVLYAAVNSNWMNNHAENMVLTASVYTGFSNSALIESSETSDFSVTLAEGQTLESGLTLSGTTITTDGTVAEGTYTYNVNIECDSWITTTGTIKITVCSPISADGVDISGGETADDPVTTFTAGTSSSITFSSNYYTSHKFVSNGYFGGTMFVNWYYSEEYGYYTRDEDKSAADIITHPADEADVKHEWNYTVTMSDGSALSSGWTATQVISSVKGVGGGTYDIVSGITLSADSTVAAGTYTFTVTLTVPCHGCYNNWLITWLGNPSETIVTKTVTIVVK